MIFNAVKSFHDKSFSYSGYEKFQIAHNYFSITTKLNKINVKKKAKPISIFDFSTLHTTIPHKPAVHMLLKFINCPSNLKSKNIYLLHFKEAGRRYVTKQTLVNAVSFLINKCYFTLLVTQFSIKILVCQWVLIQHHFRPILSFFI